MKLKRIDPLSSIAAPIETPPPNTETIEIVDFLRRLASMLSGGRNAEMLLEAADTIERLDRRAALAEQRFQEQQEDHARNLELREAAELASDNLVGEVNSLKAQFAESEAKAETERGYFADCGRSSGLKRSRTRCARYCDDSWLERFQSRRARRIESIGCSSCPPRLSVGRCRSVSAGVDSK